MARYQALLFDLDGVLIDSEALHERAKRVVYEARALGVPDAFYDEVKGRTDDDVAALVARRYGGGRATAAELVAAKHAAYRALIGQLALVEGAEPFVVWAGARYRLALTTSATREMQRLAFDRFALARHFEVILTAEDVARAKPDPDPYARTAAQLGLAPGRCLVIEDSVNGVRSGRAAGCDVAGLTTSFARDALEAAGATVVVETFADLRAWIAREEEGREDKGREAAA